MIDMKVWTIREQQSPRNENSRLRSRMLCIDWINHLMHSCGCWYFIPSWRCTWVVYPRCIVEPTMTTFDGGRDRVSVVRVHGKRRDMVDKHEMQEKAKLLDSSFDFSLVRAKNNSSINATTVSTWHVTSHQMAHHRFLLWERFFHGRA